MILVTGGTGLVGAHLLFKLINEGRKVRAIYRREKTIKRVSKVFDYYSEDVKSLFDKIQWIEADINDIPKLQEAFKGITHVYHCAAFVSFEPDKYHLLRKINIEGTANIVNLCISHSVKKLCYVSSIAAIGQNEDADKLINEQTDWNAEADNSVYAITKYGAELEVWRGTQEGLNAVIVNPGIILGAGYWNGGSSGSIFKRIYKGMPYFTHGVTGYVDVRDVINIMVLLMQSSVVNERFILISENMSFKEFQFKVAQALNVEPPRKEAKSWVLEIAWRLDWLRHKFLGKRRMLSKQNAKSAISITKYDNSKVRKSLNFEFISLDTSIENVSKVFLADISKD